MPQPKLTKERKKKDWERWPESWIGISNEIAGHAWWYCSSWEAPSMEHETMARYEATFFISAAAFFIFYFYFYTVEEARATFYIGKHFCVNYIKKTPFQLLQHPCSPKLRKLGNSLSKWKLAKMSLNNYVYQPFKPYQLCN